MLVSGPSLVLFQIPPLPGGWSFGSLPDDPRQQSVRWPRPPPDVDFLYRDVLVYLVLFSMEDCVCV